MVLTTKVKALPDKPKIRIRIRTKALTALAVVIEAVTAAVAVDVAMVGDTAHTPTTICRSRIRILTIRKTQLSLRTKSISRTPSLTKTSLMDLPATSVVNPAITSPNAPNLTSLLEYSIND